MIQVLSLSFFSRNFFSFHFSLLENQFIHRLKSEQITNVKRMSLFNQIIYEILLFIVQLTELAISLSNIVNDWRLWIGNFHVCTYKNRLPPSNGLWWRFFVQRSKPSIVWFVFLLTTTFSSYGCVQLLLKHYTLFCCCCCCCSQHTTGATSSGYVAICLFLSDKLMRNERKKEEVMILVKDRNANMPTL